MISLTKVLSKTIRGNGSSTSKPPEGSEYDWLVEGPEGELHQDAHEDGGITNNNKNHQDESREAVMEWIKSMGKKLLTGNLNLMNTSFPVKLFEDRSYLEKLADVWVYPKFLSRAAQTQDPLERMKLTITWFISGLHHGFERWKKPFNPILGETWQASLSDGSKIFMEQISHHPPISAFDLDGPDGLYRYHGLSQPSVTILMKAYGIKTVAKGYRRVEFHDGGIIDIVYPAYQIKGIVYDAKPRAEVIGMAKFKDKQHGLEAWVRFGSIKSSCNRMLRRSDAICGAIYDTSSSLLSATPLGPISAEASSITRASTPSTVYEDVEEDEEQLDVDQMLKLAAGAPRSESSSRVASPRIRAEHSQHLTMPQSSGNSASSGSYLGGLSGYLFGSGADAEEPPPGPEICKLAGSWLAHLNFGSERYWTLADCKPDVWVKPEDPLPSDCRYREDLAHLARGDLKGSQAWKEELEKRQRADKKHRPQHGH